MSCVRDRRDNTVETSRASNPSYIIPLAFKRLPTLIGRLAVFVRWLECRIVGTHFIMIRNKQNLGWLKRVWLDCFKSKKKIVKIANSKKNIQKGE